MLHVIFYRLLKTAAISNETNFKKYRYLTSLRTTKSHLVATPEKLAAKLQELNIDSDIIYVISIGLVFDF
jgi:hypothetical protein